MELKEVSGLVFLDLKKTFDTVGHAILLKKLNKDGVSSKSVKWSAGYLLT